MSAAVRDIPISISRIAALLKRAESGIDVRVPHPLTGATESLRLDRKMLSLAVARAAVRAAAGVGASVRACRSAADRGDFTALVALERRDQRPRQRKFRGRHALRGDLRRGRAAYRRGCIRLSAGQTRFGSAFAELYRQACLLVPSRAVPPEFYSVPASKVPVLIFSGGLDPATPPRHGDAVAQRLGNAKHVDRTQPRATASALKAAHRCWSRASCAMRRSSASTPSVWRAFRRRASFSAIDPRSAAPKTKP